LLELTLVLSLKYWQEFHNWTASVCPNRRTQDRERPARAVVRRTECVQVILAADELAAIEEFRFQTRMPSRSAAVRELLKRGMAPASRAGRARQQQLDAAAEDPERTVNKALQKMNCERTAESLTSAEEKRR
jgi:hypothetical protein